MVKRMRSEAVRLGERYVGCYACTDMEGNREKSVIVSRPTKHWGSWWYDTESDMVHFAPNRRYREAAKETQEAVKAFRVILMGGICGGQTNVGYLMTKKGAKS